MNFTKILNLIKEKKRIIIIAVCIAVFLVCAIWLASFFIPKDEGLDAYRTFENYSVIEEDGIKISGNPINFKELQAVNPEVCGWINIEGTNIDYPILRSSDETEEDFYLDHNYIKQESNGGAIYMQKNNSELFTDVNTILYGHDLFNGTMFSQLRKFENRDFFKKNSIISIFTPKHIYSYKIFAVVRYDDRHIPSSYHFYDEESYNLFVKHCTEDASVRNVRKDFIPKFGDKLITLSTCTSNDKERLIVVGIRIEDVATK